MNDNLKKYMYMIQNDKDFERNPIFLYGIECGSGWIPTILELLDVLSLMDSNKKIELHQIKSKFAELRFYYSYLGDDENEKTRIQNIINLYTQKINNICEICGNPSDKTNKHGWRYQMCANCLDKHNRR